MSYSMVIDLKRCVGCSGCVTNCKVSNGTPPKMERSWVARSLEGTYPNARRSIVPKLCNQCDTPPCVTVCPSGATFKDDSGVILIDKEVCMGCQSCIAACPYGARHHRADSLGYFDGELTQYEAIAYRNMPENTTDKCDFCMGRTDTGQTPEPACVRSCVAGARFFGTTEEMESFVSASGRDSHRLLEHKGTGPNVIYLSDFVNTAEA
ncbi:MAG: 4Fe-4S dicluster domain-containing protein [Eggerthellaceae bacterium]|nr:4Fe-4S dicluster domain-containing protein [Eggerthellaceae bacterium]